MGKLSPFSWFLFYSLLTDYGLSTLLPCVSHCTLNFYSRDWNFFLFIYCYLFLEMQRPDRPESGSPFSKLNPLHLTYNRSGEGLPAVTSSFHFLRLQKFLSCSIIVILRYTFYRDRYKCYIQHTIYNIYYLCISSFPWDLSIHKYGVQKENSGEFSPLPFHTNHVWLVRTVV